MAKGALSEPARAVLGVLRAHGPATAAEVAARLAPVLAGGMTASAAGRALLALRNRRLATFASHRTGRFRRFNAAVYMAREL
ncbi:MAG TPA: hypothetical protein VGB88_15485 [Alphaproteobacteria bacterium]